MKKIFFVLVFSLLVFLSFSQKYENGLTKIKYYLIDWEAKYKIGHFIDNFKDEYQYYFETKHNNLMEMFYDYNDCITKLKSQDTFISKSNSCSACVELFFKRRKITIYFDMGGNYYFNGEWHKMNSGLYYSLFIYFSNKIMPTAILNKAKLKLKEHNCCWFSNE